MCDPAGVTDLLQPNLVDFSMPPSVQKQLLAKGGCGHVQDMRRGPEEQWVVRDEREQKVLLDIYRGDTTWTPTVRGAAKNASKPRRRDSAMVAKRSKKGR